MKFWPKSLSVKDLIKIQGLLMESMNCEIQKEMFYQRWVDTRVRTSEFVPDGLDPLIIKFQKHKISSNLIPANYLVVVIFLIEWLVHWMAKSLL